MKDIDFETIDMFATIFWCGTFILAMWKLVDITIFCLHHVSISVSIH